MPLDGHCPDCSVDFDAIGGKRPALAKALLQVAAAAVDVVGKRLLVVYLDSYDEAAESVSFSVYDPGSLEVADGRRPCCGRPA